MPLSRSIDLARIGTENPYRPSTDRGINLVTVLTWYGSGQCPFAAHGCTTPLQRRHLASHA
eukprot:2153820-Rhodomonas_salina.1